MTNCKPLTIYSNRSQRETPGFGSRLAPKSIYPQCLCGASLSSCSCDNSCTAQLSSNADNKVNKLVMVFAFASAPKTDSDSSYRDRTLARLNHPYTVINSRPLTGIIPRYANSSIT